MLGAHANRHLRYSTFDGEEDCRPVRHRESGASPRLHLIPARDAPVAVVLRRGPSKRVELVRWDVERDTFERGHWFHGRIYERRSDLSPDGELLIYFASKITRRTPDDAGYTRAWTAVSRPPWLTALALWPKGDCWHGGGLFLGPGRVLLNHRPEQAGPHPKHQPRGLQVEPNPDAHGENEPIFARRLDRQGWEVVQPLALERAGGMRGFRTAAPEIRLRRHPSGRHTIALERRVEGFREQASFTVDGPGGAISLPAGRVDWVDWDQRERLVVLQGGGVYVAEVASGGVGELRTLIDLTADVPEPRKPPAHARAW